MRRNFHVVAALAAAAILSSQANAEGIIIVSTGSATGTYSNFFKSIQSKCAVDGLQLVEKQSSGCDENLDNLINKQADAAFCQADTIQFVSNNDPRAGPDQIRVLAPLYPEEVHVVGLATLAKTTGGMNILGKNILGTKQQLTSLADLEGQAVGAWGGSYTTARAISHFGGVHYDTVKFDNDKAALAALQEGKIAAIIAVGGQPLGFVKALDAKYKLLKVDASLAAKVKVYQTALVSYRNLNASGVETVSTRSMLFVKNYATPARRALFAQLKACIQQHEGDFKEGTGHHPKWSDVDLNAPTVWPLYDAGAAATPAVQPQTPAVRKKL